MGRGRLFFNAGLRRREIGIPEFVKVNEASVSLGG